MTVQLKGREKAVEVIGPLAHPRRRIKARFVGLVAAILLGIVAGWLAFTVTTGDRAAQVREIQVRRAEALVQAYESAWMTRMPTEYRVTVTGTGPGLVWVADRQVAWAHNAVTGTGPGLVTIANLQAGGSPSDAPTGTGPGLTHLPQRVGPEVAVIGTP